MLNQQDEGLSQYIRTLKGHTYDPLTKKEERKLLRRYRLHNDTDARNKLVSSNLRYAFKIANGYVGKGLSYMELLSEANNGLIESIDKFDMKYDIKLFSYSKYWIMQRMQAALERKGKMSVNVELPQENINDCGLIDDNDTCFNKSNKQDYQFEIESDIEQDATDKAYYIDTIMGVLTDREKDMINRYFGRGYEESSTLKEIGQVYGLTKERVRKIIENSLKKIRAEAILSDETIF